MFHVPTGARPDLSRDSPVRAQRQMGRTSGYLHSQVARTDLPLHFLIPLLYLNEARVTTRNPYAQVDHSRLQGPQQGPVLQDLPGEGKGAWQRRWVP